MAPARDATGAEAAHTPPASTPATPPVTSSATPPARRARVTAIPLDIPACPP